MVRRSRFGNDRPRFPRSNGLKKPPARRADLAATLVNEVGITSKSGRTGKHDDRAPAPSSHPVAWLPFDQEDENVVETPKVTCRPDPAPGALAAAQKPASPLVTAIGFGVIGGWLELAVVFSRITFNAHISMNMLRMNQHYVWMIPVSNLLIFAVVGLLMLALSRYRPGLVGRILWRTLVAVVALGLLLSVEGLYALATLCLACGVAVLFGPTLERRCAKFRRQARVVLGVLLLGLVAMAGWWYMRISLAESRALSSLPQAPRGAANLMVIVLDDVRAESLSLYGHNRPTSPNLERLSRRGILFSHARATASWTLPSHASMFTGQWPHQLSVGWDLPLDDTYPTLAERLASQGYATAGLVANTYYCNVLYGLGRGFARFEDNYENQTVSLFEILRSSAVGKRVLQALGHSIQVAEGGTALRKSAEMLNRDALKWLNERPSQRPFFLFLNYYDAHSPFVPPPGPDPRFGLGALPQREQVEILKRFHRLTTFKNVPADGPSEAIEREAAAVNRDSYESCIAYLDRQIGRLFDELEKGKLLNNTWVIVTSDHGEHFKEHGVFGHGLSLYRQEVHVPLLIIPPTQEQAGKVVSEPVSLRDLAATSVDLLGLSPACPFPGQSLAHLWRQGAESNRPPLSPLLSEIDHQTHLAPTPNVPVSLGPVKSLVDHGKVYIRNGDGREEIYDLIGDPLEARNLIGEMTSHPSLKHFRELLDRLLETPKHLASRPEARGNVLADRTEDP
jgi:arylsulfatase A-like enzyme